MKFIAVMDLNMVNGDFYSTDTSRRPPNGGKRHTIKLGEPVTAADVGGPEAFARLADADLITPADSGEARVLKKLAAARVEKELGRG